MKLSFFDNMAISTENLRYLLWKEAGIDRADWALHLASWLGPADGRTVTTSDLVRATRLIAGTQTWSPNERGRLRERLALQYSEEELELVRLVERDKVDILHQNIVFLTETLGDERLRDLAQNVGVGPVALSRWRSKSQRPHRPNQVALVSYLGLPHQVNLEEDAVFLYPGPVSDKQRRHWLKQQIDQIDTDTLGRLYPALERLLSEL